MRRSTTNVWANALEALPPLVFARNLAVISTGLVLSGCVATALTPAPVTPSSTLTATTSDTDIQQQTDGQSPILAERGADQNSSGVVDETGVPGTITVPARRPGSDAPVHPSLALANTGNGSVAAQKANTLAKANKSQTQSAAVASAIEEPVVKKTNQGFFAALFQPNPKPVVRRRRSVKKPVSPEPAKAPVAIPSPQAETSTPQTAAATAQPVVAEKPAVKKTNQGFFATLFQPNRKPIARRRKVIEKQDSVESAKAPAAVSPSQAEATTQQTIAVSTPPAETKKPVVKKASQGFFASLFQPNPKQVVRRRNAVKNPTSHEPGKARQVAILKPGNKSSLPGVRKSGLFGVFDAKEGADEGYNPVQVASVGGLARTSPNGLRIQHSKVQVACLRPELIQVLNKVQRRFGRVPIITSGYRSPSANRRARGARNSTHIYCKAADIQVTGISKWTLAKYLRSMPGRGGVGTYCYTKSVHVDIGAKRDWNWRCRRGKRRAKRN